MRLTQMQDIAGCRIVVSDITAQNLLLAKIKVMFEVVVADRREKPSHGYRAIHVIVQSTDLPVEVQLRTDLQHIWAEVSEKLFDAHGMALKYGGGPSVIRSTLDRYSDLVASFEKNLDMDVTQNEKIQKLKIDIRCAMLDVTVALEQQK